MSKLSLFLLCFTLAALLGALTASPVVADASVPQTVAFDDRLSMEWTLDNDEISISLTLTGAPAWLAMGLSPVTSSMIDADIWAAYTSPAPSASSQWVSADLFAKAHSQPPNDTQLGGTYDLLDSSISVAADQVTHRFRRKLDTGDVNYDYVLDPNASSTVVWAYGCSPVFGYHCARGITHITFANNAGSQMPPATDLLRVPAGFTVEPWAYVGPAARTLAWTPAGTLIVGSGGGSPGSLVWAVSVNQSTGEAMEVRTILENQDNPNGVAVDALGSLYVAEYTEITRYDNVDKNLLSLAGTGQVIFRVERPPSTQHAWKHVAIGPDQMLYTSVNSPCNTCLDTGKYGQIYRLDPRPADSTQAGVSLARGVRDTQGFTWDPRSELMYFSDNGRDELGDYVPVDELNVIRKEGTEHFGFPYCYGGGWEDTVRAGQFPDPVLNPSGNCTGYTPALQDLMPHTAALGIMFYTGDMFPSSYQNKLFICEHGSWNRQPPEGYRITTVDVTVDGGKASSYSVFLQGFLQPEGQVLGRPVDMVQMADGSVLFSDDLGGYIYRISYDEP